MEIASYIYFTTNPAFELRFEQKHVSPILGKPKNNIFLFCFLLLGLSTSQTERQLQQATAQSQSIPARVCKVK